MRIKVLHISISDAFGGAAIAAERLHSLMNERRDLSSKILILIKNLSDKNGVALSNFERQTARVGNFLNNFLGKFKKEQGLFSFAFVGNNLNTNPLVIDADVLYIHWVNNGMLSWKGIEQLFALKKPIILFCHDMWYFTGGCHQSNGCQNFQNKCYNCPFFNIELLQRIVHSNFEEKKVAYRKFNNVKHIVPSQDFYNKAVSSKIIDSNRITFIPNILDTDKFIPSNVKKEAIKLKVLYGAMGGKSNQYKGWEDFIYFATNITKKYENCVEIYLFGYDFGESELSNLPFKAKSFGIIRDEDEIIQMYQDMDVFIFPSKQESFGQTLLEAMSCGVIPIAYKVGIAPDIIEDKQNGFLVEINDKEGLVNSFDRLINSEIKDLKKNVRTTVDVKFSKEITMNKHLDLITSLL